MTQWQPRKTITPLKEMLHALLSPSNNKQIAAGDVEQAKLLIGVTLHQMTFIAQFSLSLEQAVQSNSVTPRTAEALLFALSEMVNLTMNTVDLLRILASSSTLSHLTSPSDIELADTVGKMDEFLDAVVEEFDL